MEKNDFIEGEKSSSSRGGDCVQNSPSKKRELEEALGKVREICRTLLEQHSREAVQSMLGDVFNGWGFSPPTTIQVIERDPGEYREAEAILREERERFLGVEDFIKGLMMWVETPEERAQVRHPLVVD